MYVPVLQFRGKREETLLGGHFTSLEENPWGEDTPQKKRLFERRKTPRSVEKKYFSHEGGGLKNTGAVVFHTGNGVLFHTTIWEVATLLREKGDKDPALYKCVCSTPQEN